jgi:Secretion system C-terminal sorting domain
MVNDIYLSTIARGNEDFTQDQKDWLYAIAAMCPFEAGPAVYRARVLVAMFDEEILFLDYDCDPNSYLRKANQEQQSSLQKQFFNLYPNPANDKLYLDYFVPDNTVGTFSLTDISGKEIFTSKLKKYNNHLLIPCEKIISGIYLFKVVTNGTVTKTGKVSIIH